MPRRPVVALAAMLLAGAIAAPRASAQQLVEETTVLAVDIDGRPYRLEALIVRPSQVPGPLPIALITHGKSHDAAQNAAVKAERMAPQARDLARRGWLAVGVVRRGFGSSEGAAARSVACGKPDFLTNFRHNAADLAAALKAVGRRPEADPTRAIAVGVSAGGAAVLALAAQSPPGLRAVVNVSGGLRVGRGDNRPCPFADALIATMGVLGTQARLPTLWVYAENDSLFDAPLIKAMHAAFAAGGGQAELQLMPPIGRDGHGIWSSFEGRRRWLPALDRFLSVNDLPTWNREAISVAIGRERIPETWRETIENYYAAPGEKVLAVSRTSRHVYWWSGPDLETSRIRGLDRCRIATRDTCTVLLENFEIVVDSRQSSH